MPLFLREKSSLKGRWRLETVQNLRSSSSNPVSCSETSIKIYGSKEEIRARKSPETVDAPGFAPDASIPVTLYGGAEGSRTPVRKRFNKTFSGRRTDSGFPPRAGTAQTARLGRVMMHGRGNSYPPHVRHINDAFPGLWPLRFRRLPLVRQRQQYECCQLIFKLPVLWRSGAAARLSSLHTPVETGAAPYRSMGKDCIFLPFRVRSPPPGRLFP